MVMVYWYVDISLTSVEWLRCWSVISRGLRLGSIVEVSVM